MEALIAFAILLLLMGVVYLVLRPFLVPDEFDEEEAFDPELVSQKNRVIDAIREIDMDYQTGKLSDEDYRLLRGRYTAAAAEILRRLDEEDAARALARPTDESEPREDDDTPGDEADDDEFERRIAERRKELQRKGLKEGAR